MTDDLLVKSLKERFDLEPVKLFPVSIWFSYGSNLSSVDFAAKMCRLKSSLTLIKPQVALLNGYQRILGNKSRAHGLSYTIIRAAASVKGIIHEIPYEHLKEYLRMEGVMDQEGVRADDERTYDVSHVSVNIEDSDLEVLTLIGRFPQTIIDVPPSKYSELLRYIETARRGAAHCEIETVGFDADYEAVARAINRNRHS